MGLQTGNVGSFPLNGSPADVSGRGNVLTLVNAPTYAAGKIGPGLLLARASTQYATHAAYTDLANLPAVWWWGWVKLTSEPGVMTVFELDTAAAGVIFRVFYAVGAGFRAFVNSNTVTLFNVNDTSLGDPTIGSLHLVNAWVDNLGSTLNIKLDNLATVSAAFTGPIRQDASPTLYLGAGTAGSTPIDGVLDAANVYARIPTAQDLLDTWNGGPGIEPFRSIWRDNLIPNAWRAA